VQIDISSCLQKLTTRKDITITSSCTKFFPIERVFIPSHLLHKYLKQTQQKTPARMYCAFFNPDWNLLLQLLSVAKSIFFNRIHKIKSIIYARTVTELLLIEKVIWNRFTNGKILNVVAVWIYLPYLIDKLIRN